MYYYISLPITIALYVLGLLLLRHVKNKAATNIVFCISIEALYAATVIITYVKNGPLDWNFTNTLPTANVSPFMFLFCPLALALPKKIKWVPQILISLLSVGMFLSPMISIVFNGMRDYAFHFLFYIGYLDHLLLSLWGCYFVISKQIDLTPKKALISGSVIVCVALMMLTLNLIFKTAFFGLALDDKFNIYNMKIVDNAYLSALLYFAGMFIILVAGYFYQKLVFRCAKSDASC